MIKCRQCGERFAPRCHRTKMCSPRCTKERRKERHRSPEYVARNMAGRLKRRRAEPGAEYQSLKIRRPWKAAYNAKRGNARRRGVDFALTERWFEEKYKAGCALTGIAFGMGQGVISPYSATVDRINNKKGYTPRNCRMVIHAVNAMRGTGTDKQMYEIAEKLLTNRKAT